MFHVVAVLAVVYYGVGYWLTEKALKHFRQSDRRPGHKYDAPRFTDLYDPENFGPEGQAARRLALRWWWLGLATLAAVVALSVSGGQ